MCCVTLCPAKCGGKSRTWAPLDKLTLCKLTEACTGNGKGNAEPHAVAT